MKLLWISLVLMIGWLIANSPTASAQCGAGKQDCGTGERTEQSPGIQVCNETSGMIWVSFAYVENDEWYSRGWWTIRRGECKETITNIVGAVYDYVDLEDGHNQWAGKEEALSSSFVPRSCHGVGSVAPGCPILRGFSRVGMRA